MHCIQRLIKTTVLLSIIFHDLMTLRSLGSCVYLTHTVNRGLVLLQVLCTIYAPFSGQSYGFNIETNKVLRTNSDFLPIERNV